MFIAEVIIWVGMIAWIFPPFRHYRRRYFYFFLILALMDPFAIILLKCMHISTHKTFSSLVYLLFISILSFTKEIKYYIYIFLGFLSVTFISANLSVQHNRLQISILLLVILLVFIKRIVSESGNKLIINGFLFALIIYILTLILKVLFRFFEIPGNILYFHITSAFEILFAIFFTIFHDNDERLQIKLPERRDAVEI